MYLYMIYQAILFYGSGLLLTTFGLLSRLYAAVIITVAMASSWGVIFCFLTIVPTGSVLEGLSLFQQFLWLSLVSRNMMPYILHTMMVLTTQDRFCWDIPFELRKMGRLSALYPQYYICSYTISGKLFGGGFGEVFIGNNFCGLGYVGTCLPCFYICRGLFVANLLFLSLQV